MIVQCLMLSIPCGQLPRVLPRVRKVEASLVGCRTILLELIALIDIQGNSRNLQGRPELG